jgi:phage shock protein E
MLDFFKKLFSKTDYKDLLERGAQIVDVRSKGEFVGGHIPMSINIPLDQLQSGLSKLDKNKPVIACCASGMRSASAVPIIKAKGFAEVVNGGGWNGLYNKLENAMK